MKHIKLQDSSVNDFLSGVYMITFPNGKKYIGISNNIHRRMLEHNVNFRNNLPIEYAILKYGKITEYDILEFIPAENRALMQEREKYWIKYYDTINKDKGYNISSGGDGADIGSLNSSAKLTEEQVLEIYYILAHLPEINFEDICKRYNLNISSLSRLNNGHSYFHSTIKYPVRDAKNCKKNIAGTKSVNAKLTIQDLENIYNLLINHTELSIAKISELTGFSTTILQNINNGKTYHNDNLTYPLRIHKTGAKKFTNDIIKSFIQDIKDNPLISLAKLGEKYGISRKAVSQINLGLTYKQPDEIYPIRKNNNAVSTISESGELGYY